MNSQIAGVLFDFCAALSIGPGFSVGARSDATHLVEALQSWAKERGLRLDVIDQDWTKADSVLPMTTERDRTAVTSVSGGACEMNNMPNGLTLSWTFLTGKTISCQYEQERSRLDMATSDELLTELQARIKLDNRTLNQKGYEG